MRQGGERMRVLPGLLGGLPASLALVLAVFDGSPLAVTVAMIASVLLISALRSRALGAPRAAVTPGQARRRVTELPPLAQREPGMPGRPQQPRAPGHRLLVGAAR